MAYLAAYATLTCDLELLTFDPQTG